MTVVHSVGLLENAHLPLGLEGSLGQVVVTVQGQGAHAAGGHADCGREK